MALGTAGLTALLACDRLAAVVSPRHARPEEAWLVTGASGGVGMLSVAVLAAAGHRVVACSRKAAAIDMLRALGAAEVVGPEAVVDPTPKTLVTGRWAGVVDTVGGALLANVLRAVRPGGGVAAVGMAGGADLLTSVHPFILRGVTLAGIDAASLPTQAERAVLWERLAAFWPTVAGRLPVTRLRLADSGAWADCMRRGETTGRGVVIPE
jgi:putative YhdH/YhfP family quinone oxidoreductase